MSSPIAGVDRDTRAGGCGRNWYAPLAGCEGEASWAIAHMPDHIEMIFSEVRHHLCHYLTRYSDNCAPAMHETRVVLLLPRSV